MRFTSCGECKGPTSFGFFFGLTWSLSETTLKELWGWIKMRWGVRLGGDMGSAIAGRPSRTYIVLRASCRLWWPFVQKKGKGAGGGLRAR